MSKAGDKLGISKNRKVSQCECGVVSEKWHKKDEGSDHGRCCNSNKRLSCQGEVLMEANRSECVVCGCL